MLFNPSDIENLEICKKLAITLNEFYDTYYINKPIYPVGSKEYKDAENIIFGLYDIILRIENLFYGYKYTSVDSVNNLNSAVELLMNVDLKSSQNINLGFFFERVAEFLNKFHEIKEYKGEFDIDVRRLLRKIDDFNNTNSLIEKLKRDQESLLKKIDEVEIISEDLKNKKVHEIFEDDSEKFKSLARRYEFAFYAALAFLFLYFFGWYIEIDTANFKFKFAEQFHGNHTPTFYVQKISLLILSTTLAAFLLKRSFMNRRLADDAYRTAKELDALPRYMEGMPDEMKEKIRFDLAYKYFGNGIHHESYTGGENLMHENIKANTDFIIAVKDLTPKVEVPKEDKAPKDTA